MIVEVESRLMEVEIIYLQNNRSTVLLWKFCYNSDSFI
jgi:hypothetical protein